MKKVTGSWIVIRSDFDVVGFDLVDHLSTVHSNHLEPTPECLMLEL